MPGLLTPVAAGSGQRFVVDGDGGVDAAFPGVAPGRARDHGRRATSRAASSRRSEPIASASASTSSTGDEARRVAADLAQHRDVAAHDRRALRHRLEHRDPEALVAAREHEQVGARVERRSRPLATPGPAACTRSPSRRIAASSSASHPASPASTSRCGTSDSSSRANASSSTRDVLARLERADPEHVRPVVDARTLRAPRRRRRRWRASRSTPFGTTRMRSRGIGVFAAISSAANSDTAITSRARRAAAAKPRVWNHRPRRVVASGIVIGAASCTVTTSGTPSHGGTAGDGACTRSTGATRRAGPAAPEHVPRVVEHRTRERQDRRCRRRGSRASASAASTPTREWRAVNTETSTAGRARGEEPHELRRCTARCRRVPAGGAVRRSRRPARSRAHYRDRVRVLLDVSAVPDKTRRRGRVHHRARARSSRRRDDLELVLARRAAATPRAGARIAPAARGPRGRARVAARCASRGNSSAGRGSHAKLGVDVWHGPHYTMPAAAPRPRGRHGARPHVLRPSRVARTCEGGVLPACDRRVGTARGGDRLRERHHRGAPARARTRRPATSSSSTTASTPSGSVPPTTRRGATTTPASPRSASRRPTSRSSARSSRARTSRRSSTRSRTRRRRVPGPRLVLAGRPGWGADAVDAAVAESGVAERASCGRATSPTTRSPAFLRARRGRHVPVTRGGLRAPAARGDGVRARPCSPPPTSRPPTSPATRSRPRAPDPAALADGIRQRARPGEAAGCGARRFGARRPVLVVGRRRAPRRGVPGRPDREPVGRRRNPAGRVGEFHMCHPGAARRRNDLALLRRIATPRSGASDESRSAADEDTSSLWLAPVRNLTWVTAHFGHR